ncbi:MAG TPA: Mur ligase family protein, partial [Micavibrio sp.]
MTTGSNTIWTAKEAEAATHGQSTQDWHASGISIDTRTMAPGDLFIAIKGDSMDGHQFVAEALRKGAAAAVVSHVPDGVSGPLLVVADTMKAMQDLGCAARFRCHAKIIGITGSVGKTGTKELLAAAFGALGQTHASKGSFNNHWGVPYTLAAMNPGSDYGIFEMGMNHANEITPLSQMVRPDIAIITTVAPVHLENFESEQDIADAKAEIFNGMDHNGVALLPQDNQWFAHLKAAAMTQGVKVYGFGEHADADIRLLDCLE